MQDLTAQVTSSLLPFPGVTIDALGEDEITLDSVLHGKFTIGRTGLAWLACGPHLEVVHGTTGERLSAYCFSGGGEHPPSVLAARDFSWLKRSGLLVGLEEAEGSVLCLYDLGLSRVVKAVVIPGRITAIDPLVSYGGASTLTQHLHQSLRWFFGIAAVVTDLGHVLLVDLCLDDLSCSQSELEASDLQVVTKSPEEIPRLREISTRQGRHLCLQLNGPSGVGAGATAVQYISKTNQLAVGFSDGYLQLWNMKALKKEYHSQLEGGRVPVLAFTFQEPENDPRNCCYLWAVQSAQELEGDMVSLRLLQLAFSERKCLASGKILYEGLEYCEERYSQELSGSAFPLRAQTTNTRLLSCQTIEKFRPHPDRDDSMNEVASPDTSVSIFTWQVKAYGQGTLSTYVGVFDINRWYHAQMPDSLRMGESLQNCPYLAVWSLDALMQIASSHILLDVVVHDRSLSRGLPFTCPPPEQYFDPTTYNFDATCLLNSGIVHLTCSGYQKETLRFLKKAAPCSSDVISTGYSRCLMSGLLTSRPADNQASNLSQEEQLDAILTTAVENSSLGLITGCIKQWTAEEQPGSALSLRYILDWAWNKVVQTKEEVDGICAPLFDSSSNFTDSQTMQLLQHSQRLLSNLSTIFHCLLSEAQELTQKGRMGLMNKNTVSSLISKYAQVVLWFCRTGLLPEGSDDNALQLSRPFYTHSVISNYYTIRREELTSLASKKWCADFLMIDSLISHCGDRLTNLWKRDEGGTGQYPPPSLHALLDIYLLDNIDEAAKHAIVIYLLLDVMYSFPNKDGASVESFPTAFAIPIGLVKLVQGLWLLDHNDYQRSFELLLHPAASQCQFEWQHERVLQALMCQRQHLLALRYFHITKPPISSTSQAKLYLSVLLHNKCLIEAWSLLRQHSNRLNMGELLGFLYQSCQELDLIKELFKLPLGIREQECLEKFLLGTGGLQNRELLMVHYLQQANYIPALKLNHNLKMNLVNERDPKLKERFNTRNSILDQYGKVLPTVQRKLAMERAKPYQHPYAIHKEVARPQPLSTITKRSASEKVISRAGFINNVLTKIEEVWLGRGPTPQSSPTKSPRASDVQSPKPSLLAPPDPFLGTPITMTSKQKSRMMDLVHPSCQNRPLLSPPKPCSSWVSPKSNSKAPEFSLLQTPQVVKRARALAASGTVFSAFTPQSILRSSLRPTPVATPSASPGRSITPPIRSKENRITFIEEAESPEPEKGIHWTNGMAADSEIRLLISGSTLSKATCKTWSSQPAEEEGVEEELQRCVKFVPPEGGISSPEPRCFEIESENETDFDESKPPNTTQAQHTLSFDTTQTSVRSTDTTLEFYDAPLSEKQDEEEGHSAAEEDDNVVSVNIKDLTEMEEPKEQISSTTAQIPLMTEDHVSEEGEAQEEEIFEELMETEHEQTENEVELQQDDEKYLSTHDQVDNQDCNQVTESTDSSSQIESQEQPVTATGHGIQSEDNVSTEIPEQLKPTGESEPTYEQGEELEQSTDLTEFVQRHLFGSDLSPPLTRSGIRNASQIQTSFNSESTAEVEEEDKEQATVETPQEFSSQKSSLSDTSSEPTGTDSHSVLSLNDSEELSSLVSEEEGGEESDQSEEEDDSGSEVEIIEEVQGNGRLSSLQPSSVFVEEGHTDFLQNLTEPEASEFSLITPGEEIKMVEENMEGEMVMVRLGTDETGMVADEVEEQESSYMELKPSATLLVPLELMEAQDGLVEGSQLAICEFPKTVMPDDLRAETQNSFSLMLDADEDADKDICVLPMANDMHVFDPPPLSPAMEGIVDPVGQPEVILLDIENQDALLCGKSSEEDQRQEMEILDGVDVDGLTRSKLVKPTDQADLQTDNSEETVEQMDADLVILAEDLEPGDLSVSESTPVEEAPAIVYEKEVTVEIDSAEEQMEVHGAETEDNGNTHIYAEIAPNAEAAPAGIAPNAEAAPAGIAPNAEAAPAGIAPNAEAAPAGIAPNAEAAPAGIAPNAEAAPAGIAPNAEAAPAGIAPNAEAEPAATAPNVEFAPVAIAPNAEAAPVLIAQNAEAAPVVIAHNAGAALVVISPNAEAAPAWMAPNAEAAPAGIAPNAEVAPAGIAPNAEAAPAEIAPNAEAAPDAIAPNTEAAPAAIAPNAEAAPDAIAPNTEAAPAAIAPNAEAAPAAIAPNAEAAPAAIAPNAEAAPAAIAPNAEAAPAAIAHNAEATSVAITPSTEATPVAIAPIAEAAPLVFAFNAEAALVVIAPNADAAAVVIAPNADAAAVLIAPNAEAAPVALAPNAEAVPVAIAPNAEAAPAGIDPDAQAAPAAIAPNAEATPAGIVPDAQAAPAAIAPDAEAAPAAIAPNAEAAPAAIAPNAEAAPVVEERQQELEASPETEEEIKEDNAMEQETKRRTKGAQRIDKNVEKIPVSNSPQKDQNVSEPQTSSQVNEKYPSTPTRRITRGRTVSFISPLLAEEPQEDGKVGEEDSSIRVPASSRRTPRKSKDIQIRESPPRRSARKAQSELLKDKEEAMDNDTRVALISKASSPARRWASQTGTSIRSSQSGSEEIFTTTEIEINKEQADDVTDKDAPQRTSSKTPTLSKRRSTQELTPRRSSRRMLSSKEVVLAPLEILNEEKEQEAFESPVKRSSRKTKTKPSETEQPEEEENKKQRVSSPGRMTRQFNRNTLNVYPQVKLVPISLPQRTRNIRGKAITEDINDDEALLEPKLNSDAGRTSSLRLERSKLWNHPDEDLPLLDSPLEVDSETPVADALIKRLQDEEEKQEGKVVITKLARTSKRTEKLSVEHVEIAPAMKYDVIPEPKEDESSPDENSFIYSPSRTGTGTGRANRAKSPRPSAPLTRSRRRVNKDTSVAPPDEILLEEGRGDAVKPEHASKGGKTAKRTTKSKPVLAPPPVAEVDLISPLPSPADPLPRALKRITEGEAPAISMNLRRKRVMDAVFTKPVTRRKKL